MKKLISALSAAVLAANALGTIANASFLYNEQAPRDNSYYCIVSLDDKPLSCYDYAKQFGTDQFIFTAEGKTAYDKLKADHGEALGKINGLLGKSNEIVYDYTSVYNGFSVVLKESEYKKIWYNKDSLGLKDIYISDFYNNNQEPSSADKQSKTSAMSYSDLTDRILEETGISKVENKGDSTVIAIIDNEFDLSHEFISTPSSEASYRLSAEDIGTVAPYLSADSDNGSNYYYNEKIPFRFNYENHNNDTSIDYKNNPNDFHGTHVAGIAAGNGNAETDDKYNAKGAAPNAQLLLMSSYNLCSYALLAAFDDCTYLGTDIVNASWGAGFVNSNAIKYESEAIENMTESGILFCSAAGNNAKINYQGNDSLINTDYSSGGTPNGISSVLSVGSAENTVSEKRVISSSGKNFEIMSGSKDINTAFADMTMEYAAVPGLGYPEDYKNIDVKGKIALISRGELTFDEKAENAKANGAVGVIFYNNENGLLTPQCSVLPSGFISYESGMELIGFNDKAITFPSEKQIIASFSKSMSEFSSWDYTEDLTLKPDITAFGGNIISSYPENEYGPMSGTSMSSPQLTGMAALLKEYLTDNKDKYGIQNNSDYPELMARLLMSTSTPIYSSDELEIASPRVQGSGIANVESAIKTPAYLYTDSQKDNYRPKISLGDGLDQNLGSFSFTFNIKNISDTAQTYNLSSDVFRDDSEEDQLAWNTKKIEAKTTFKQGFSEISEITVPAGESVALNVTVSISTDEAEYIQDNFANGTFIDGYIYLKNESAPDLTLPFMGFYGSWSDSEVFEPFIYNSRKLPSLYPSIMADGNYNPAGLNAVAGIFDETIINTPSFSPNGDNILDNMLLYLGFKRRCYNVEAEIYSNSTHELVYSEQFIMEDGGWSADENQEPINNSYKINWDFAGVSDGEIYELKLSAIKPISGQKEIISQEFIIDLTPPSIEECSTITINDEKYLLIKASDANAIQGALLIDNNSAGESELIDAYYCDSNVKNCIITLGLPQNDDSCSSEIYDAAGNRVTVSADSAAEEYFLNFDENMFFSTADRTFKNKISLTDSMGNDIDFNVSSTPEKAYAEGITEISVMLGYLEIASIPVNVGLAGDTDRNNVTDLYDAIKIAKYLIWQSNPNGSFKNDFVNFEGSFEAYLADYDLNGQIDLYDAIGIARTLMPSSN